MDNKMETKRGLGNSSEDIYLVEGLESKTLNINHYPILPLKSQHLNPHFCEVYNLLPF